MPGVRIPTDPADRQHEDAGDNVAALYTLVGTCEAHGVNPFEYLRDVLLRVSTHPASDIDALLGHRCTPPVSGLGDRPKAAKDDHLKTGQRG